MDLKILNTSNSFKRDLRLYAEVSGSSLILYPSRYTKSGQNLYTIFYGDLISKFPRNSSEEYQHTTTSINFAEGTITGGDQVSVDFTPITPTEGQAIVGIISIDKDDRLYIRTNLTKSIDAATWDFENGVFPIQKGKIPLYGFFVQNSGGVTSLKRICNIFPEIGNIPFDTADIVYTNDDNFSIGSIFTEYLHDEAVLYQNEIKVKSTKLKRGDSIALKSSTTLPQIRTVISVNYGTSFDTITLDQNLTESLSLINNPFVTLNTFADVSNVFNGSSGKILYDSGWNTCVVNTSYTLTHDLSIPLGTYTPVVYFNTTQSMVNAKKLSSYAWGASFSTKIGVQIKLASTTVTLRFAPSGIINTINNSGVNVGTETTGYYRFLLLGN
jgi:hypothetical protein